MSHPGLPPGVSSSGLRFTKRQIKLRILEVHAGLPPGQSHHKMSVIGRAISDGKGLLEIRHPMLMTLEERALSAKAYDELRDEGLLAPTYSDLSDPDNWCFLTDRGRVLLERRLLDPLDEALANIDNSLVDARDAAHDAMRSAGPQSRSQAANAAQELIDRILRTLAPDEQVKAAGWWTPERSARNGITRAHRVRFALELELRGRIDEADSIAQALTSASEDLQAMKHTGGAHLGISAEDAVSHAEITLRRLLLGTNPTE